jgi:hypothetical protein
VGKPQVIDDEEHEQAYQRVAAVDVAKASGVVCTRAPHPSRLGARQSAVWTVPATMGAVADLAGELAAAGIEKVTLESTSDYWRVRYYVLEAAGLQRHPHPGSLTSTASPPASRNSRLRRRCRLPS